MAEQDNNQETRVRPGGGASAGLDIGTDREQNNRESSGGAQSGEVDSHNDDARAAGDKNGADEAESISKTGNAFRGEVGMGTGESTGATKGFVTASPETEKKRKEQQG